MIEYLKTSVTLINYIHFVNLITDYLRFGSHLLLTIVIILIIVDKTVVRGCKNFRSEVVFLEHINYVKGNFLLKLF